MPELRIDQDNSRRYSHPRPYLISGDRSQFDVLHSLFFLPPLPLPLSVDAEVPLHYIAAALHARNGVDTAGDIIIVARHFFQAAGDGSIFRREVYNVIPPQVLPLPVRPGTDRGDVETVYDTDTRFRPGQFIHLYASR
jgi:hypothetical protein